MDVKAGVVDGETNDFSYSMFRDPVYIRDMNATLLHLRGSDHNGLTDSFQGLGQKLLRAEGLAHRVRRIPA